MSGTDRVLPAPLALALKLHSKSESIELLGDAVLLLVRVDDPRSELARSLTESSSLESDRLFPTVEVEQGRTTIESQAFEPEASGAERSASVKSRVTRRSTSSRPRSISWRSTCCPHRDRTA